MTNPNNALEQTAGSHSLATAAHRERETANGTSARTQVNPDGDESRSDVALRRVASWLAILGTWALAGYFFGFLIYHSLWPTSSRSSWLIRVIELHYAATIGLPMSAISSACIVLLLKATAGPIEFEALGFRFRGASGPVVLWIFCFLAMIAALRLLWNLGSAA